jgi:GDPmannose 4,6-dehydratase
VKTALITGITGQDGAFLAQHLLGKHYRVVGAARRNSGRGSWRLEELGIADRVELVPFDLYEPHSMVRMLERVGPDEVYNLAAQCYVHVSFEQPLYTADVTGVGVLRLLEAVRQAAPGARFYQASTSEMFGLTRGQRSNESSPFYPRSPYAVAKLMAHWATINYRESYGLHASCGILFNHESSLRGPEFVTRHITMAVARIARGDRRPLILGNLEARRDWGYSPDFVEGMWRMLQQEVPSEYVLATGEVHSVRDFVEAAFGAVGESIVWRGAGAEEQGISSATGATLVAVSPEQFRPAEVDYLEGDPTKARERLGWTPTVAFRGLVEGMVNADLLRLRRAERMAA